MYLAVCFTSVNCIDKGVLARILDLLAREGELELQPMLNAGLRIDQPLLLPLEGVHIVIIE